MKQISHIVPAHPVFFGMTKFWAEQFPEFCFEVYLMKAKNDKSVYEFPNKNIHIIEYSSNEELATYTIEILKQSKIVFLHCSFFPLVTKIKLIIKGIYKYINKVVWIEWGSDLYYWDSSSLTSKIKSSIKKIMVNLFEKRFPHFIAIHPADIKSYHNIINGSAQIYCAPYTSKKGMDKPVVQSVKETIAKKIQQDRPVVIQIGHRADHILNHKDTLKLLSRFSNKNIKIYIPLAYGDEDYAFSVKSYARNIFGNKVVFHTDVVPYEEYIERLQSVDIFILNSKRQIALGNLHPMIVMQKKIVMPSQSVLYDFFKDNVPIFPYEKLKNCSFDEFIDDVDMRLAKDFVLNLRNVDPVYTWRNVFVKIINSYK